MIWKIEFEESARKTLKKLDKPIQKKIIDYLEKRIATHDNPRRFGKGLSYELYGLWRYRVEDYRIVCRIEDHELIVLVVHIGHRKKVY